MQNCGTTSGFSIMKTLFLIQEVLVQSLSQKWNTHPTHKISLPAALICSQNVKASCKEQILMAWSTHKDIWQSTYTEFLTRASKNVWKHEEKNGGKYWRQWKLLWRGQSFEFCNFVITEVLLTYPHFFFTWPHIHTHTHTYIYIYIYIYILRKILQQFTT